MSASNLLFVATTCPQCGHTGEMAFYIGGAASFGLDEHGERFYMREYRVGDRLQWVEPDDPLFNDCCADRWGIRQLDDGSYLETNAACRCPACNADIIADVLYRDMIITSFGNVRTRPPFRPMPTKSGGSAT